ncbi:MAG: hypothetical protein HC915_12380 [Anaerolineae bacterium]|nr:hypothetical protein [Anaerolineae bacterium]
MGSQPRGPIAPPGAHPASPSSPYYSPQGYPPYDPYAAQQPGYGQAQPGYGPPPSATQAGGLGATGYPGNYQGGIAQPEQSYGNRQRQRLLIGAGVVTVMVVLCVLGVIVVALLAGGGGNGEGEAVVPPTPPRIADPGSILYSASNNNQLDIFLADVNGRNQRRLTTSSANEAGAVFSPNGRLIAFHSYSGASGPADIWVMNADGTSPRRLTSSPGDERNPVWSPDSTQLAYQNNEGGDYDIWIIPVEGEGQARNLTNSSANDEAPAWSLYNTLAFQSDQLGTSQIFLISSTGGNRRQITNTLTDAEAPAWTPDAARLVFTLQSPQGSRLAVVNPDGGGFQDIFANSANDRNGRWLNGSTLVFTGGPANAPTVYLADFRLGQITQLVNGGFQPDGRPR